MLRTPLNQRQGNGAARCMLAKFLTARLETRTKESTHIRKCVGIMPICIVNVTVVIYAAPFDLYLRREV